MLTAADLAGFDLPALAASLTDAAIYQDRCRRQAQRIGVPADALNTRLDILGMDQHAAAIAEGARFASLVARLVADQNERRSAPVLRLVPREEPVAVPAPQSARGVVARMCAGLFGARAVKVA